MARATRPRRRPAPPCWSERQAAGESQEAGPSARPEYEYGSAVREVHGDHPRPRNGPTDHAHSLAGGQRCCRWGADWVRKPPLASRRLSFIQEAGGRPEFTNRAVRRALAPALLGVGQGDIRGPAAEPLVGSLAAVEPEVVAMIQDDPQLSLATRNGPVPLHAVSRIGIPSSWRLRGGLPKRRCGLIHEYSQGPAERATHAM